jgi:transposase-like protein
MTADLTNPIFNDEDAAWAHFEAIRWPSGRACFHCGVIGQSEASKGKTTRRGLYNCRACDKPFTATMGTVYERSHIPMHKWLLATHLMAASKKGISAHQLFRMLGFGSYRTAWFMAHRIREAMRDDDPTPLGGNGKVVEVDETFIGPPADVFVNDRGWVKQRGTTSKRKVISLVERGGRARSIKVEELDIPTIRAALANVSRESRLHTDQAQHYKRVGREFAAHESVNHGELEYARGDVTTNTVEGFFGIFKRGMRGIYQHCGEQHLHRYLVEFDFRYSNRIALGVDDKDRAAKAVAGAAGKRLTYRQPDGEGPFRLTA